MRLLARYLESQTPRPSRRACGWKRLAAATAWPELAAAIARARRHSRAARACGCAMALDYSGRDAILAAARSPRASRESLDDALGPPVDLLIRTGGERRLSDFLLWECAYAELVFSRRMWPDFRPRDLARGRARIPHPPSPLRRRTRQPHARSRRLARLKGRYGAVTPIPPLPHGSALWSRLYKVARMRTPARFPGATRRRI